MMVVIPKLEKEKLGLQEDLDEDNKKVKELV